MSLLKRSAVGFVWNHFGRVGEYLLMFVFSVLVARKLGAEMNGYYATFLSAIQFFLILSSLGLETSATVNLPRVISGKSSAEVAGTLQGMLIVRVGVSVVVLVLAFATRDWLTHLLHLPVQFMALLWILLLYFVQRGIVSLLTSFYTAKLETQIPAMAAFSMRTLDVVGGIVLLSAGLGLRGVFLIVTFTVSVQASALFLLMRDVLGGVGSLAHLPSVVKSGVKFWINGLLEFVLGRQADILLLSYFLVGATIVGFYDVATSFAYAINFGITSGLYGLSVATFASFAALDHKRLTELWEFLARFVVLTVVPVFVFSAFFADTVVPAIYSRTYVSSIPIFQTFAVFLIATRFLGGGVAADYLQSAGRIRWLLISSLISGAVNLVLAFTLIPRFGAMGAIFATGVAALVIAAMHGFYSWKLLQVRFPLRSGTLVLISGLLAAMLTKALASGVAEANLAAIVAGYMLFFGFFAYLLRPLSTADVRLLAEIHETLGRVFAPFARHDVPGDGGVSSSALTDRQKWAFAWLPKCGVVLDVGSSSSPLCEALSQKAARAVVVDIDEDALRTAKAGTGRVSPVGAYAERLPFPSNSADVVLLLDVIEHLRDDAAAINEAERVLRPGGKLILSVPHKGLFRFLDPENLSARVKGRYSPTNRHRHYSEDDLTRLLFLKFRIVRRHYGGLFIYPLSFAANHWVHKHLRRDCGRFFKKLGDWDNDVSWGKLSYNLVLVAEKI